MNRCRHYSVKYLNIFNTSVKTELGGLSVLTTNKNAET